MAALRWVQDGAAAGFTAGQAGLVIGALAVMLVMRFLADANRISLHDIYRWRLSTAYAVMRKTAPHDGNPAPFGTKNAPGTLPVAAARASSRDWSCAPRLTSTPSARCRPGAAG